ncbi:MAG: hypothetical protein ACK5LT_02580 [Lachnospirales bacterium]
MNWKKAKNLVLIFLIVLNLFLLTFNYSSKTIYTMTLEQEKTILSVLSEYNIGIYVELPKVFTPMYDMEIINKGNSIAEELIEVFFNEDIQPLYDENRLVYQSSEGSLTIENGFFSFTSLEGINKNYEDILSEFKMYDDLELEKILVEDTITTYEYCEKVEDYILYSNYLSITVEDNLITRINGYNSEPNGFIGEKKDIISVDMALFNFAKEVKRTGAENIFVDKIDIVYYLYDEAVSEEGVVLKAIPCYRINIEGNPEAFLINAYNNQIINLF